MNCKKTEMSSDAVIERCRIAIDVTALMNPEMSHTHPEDQGHGAKFLILQEY
jgi:hypothetical protein